MYVLQIRLAWRNSNKTVSLSFMQHGSRGVVVKRYGCYTSELVFGLTLTLPTTFLIFFILRVTLCVSVRLGLAFAYG